MTVEPWTWDGLTHPDVAATLAPAAVDLSWCDRLESAASDAITGKVLCVCAASAVAREVVSYGGGSPPATGALELLGRWIDDPTGERFEHIYSLVFGENSPEFDPYGTVWWALRTATSSLGNFEAGWALAAACSAAVESGLTPERTRSIAERELRSRTRSLRRLSAEQV
jgi:hypothetical protein